MNEDNQNETHQSGNPTGSWNFPPKPQVVEKKDNLIRRSLISLVIYAALFMLIFQASISYVAGLLLVIIVHELGHFAFMKLFNYSNVKIFIVPLLGGFTTGRKQQVSQWQLTLIILGGPVPGIIIGSILFWLNKDWNNESVKMLYQMILFINILNCLPFYPLDGGRLIETMFFKDNFIIRLVFGIISVIALLSFQLVEFNPFLLIIPVFIGIELYNEIKHNKIREYLKQENINYHTDYDNLPDRDYWLIRDCLILSFPKKYASVTPGSYQYSSVEPVLINHISSVLQVNLNQDMGVFAKIIMTLFYISLFIGPLALYYFLR